MNIQINADYRLVSDANQVMVQKYAGTSSEAGALWRPVSYHPTVKQAIESLYQRCLRECEAHTLAELKESAEHAAEQLKNAYCTACDIEVSKPCAT